MLVPNRHFSPLKLVIDRERQCALMLNPKVLTQFTRNFMAEGYRQFYGREDASEGRYGILHAARRMPVAPLRDYLHFVRKPEEYAIYGFVRNPYGRLVSAYKNKFYDVGANPEGHEDSDYPRDVRQRHIKHVRDYARKHGLGGAECGTLVPFETFLRYASADRRGRADHHWNPQVDVLMADRLNYAGFFKFETDLEQGFRVVAQAFGFDEDWAVERLGTKRNASVVRENLFLSEDLLPLFEPLCREDCKTFGYDPESWREY